MTTLSNKPKKTTSKLERYLMDTMFEKAVFADLSLVFIHPSFPFSMRFNVHRSIVSQSPFLCKLLENMEQISTVAAPTGGTEENETSSSGEEDVDSTTTVKQKSTTIEGVTSLTIDLAKALTHCGFILAPFQHIVRRKWQKTTNTDKKATGKAANKSKDLHPLLACHIRFALQWMYCLDKAELIKTMKDQDTLRILSVAVLLDLHDLTQACINRYTTQQLSLESIMRDLETICQLPRGHRAYLQLRDAALLLLFRYGPEQAKQLALLPVDYMADILSADPLFVGCEFDRYCLLRAVLMSFMQSLGKISWTPKGPVDQDQKRLSGFVRPVQKQQQFSQLVEKTEMSLTADTVRSRKRKRIPSQDLEDPALTITKKPQQNSTVQEKSRLSFAARIPFEKFKEEPNSGGVVDKATVLSYLLRTTVNYSNMTFDQLTTVRQDGIVPEELVFRALWQREALERVLFPLTYQVHEQTQENQHKNKSDDRSAALDEYFDVDSSDAQEKRRRLLLGTPRFRFKSSVTISPPSVENGWECDEIRAGQFVDSAVDLGDAFDDDDSDGSLWSAAQDDEGVNELQVGGEEGSAVEQRNKSQAGRGPLRNRSNTVESYKLYKKTFYSEAETILGISYRVQVEAQVMPRHRLIIQDDKAIDGEQEEEDEEISELYAEHTNADDNVIVCRFELQRDMKQIALPPPIPIKKEKEARRRYLMAAKSTTSIPPTTKPSNNNSSSLSSSPVAVSAAKPPTSSSSAYSAATVVTTTTTTATITAKPSGSTVSHIPRPVITIPTKAPSSSSYSAAVEKQKQQKQQQQQQGIREKTKIHYFIYCLNRHEGIIEHDRIDPEDRVLVAVTEQCEREDGQPGEMEPGYVGQVMIDSANLSAPLTIDATVVVEIFGFQKV